MTITLNCPVCGYKEIEGKTCPNCDTDLSLIRMLQELPQAQALCPKAKVTAWQLAAAGIILFVGIGLGVLGSFFFLQPQTLTVTVPSPNPVVIKNPNHTPISVAPAIAVKVPQATTYTVKFKDSLSVLAEKFCGKGTSWQVMLKANPQLKGRENYIEVGEILKLPNCWKVEG